MKNQKDFTVTIKPNSVSIFFCARFTDRMIEWFLIILPNYGGNKFNDFCEDDNDSLRYWIFSMIIIIMKFLLAAIHDFHHSKDLLQSENFV